MKNQLFLLLFLTVLWACENNNSGESQTSDKDVKQWTMEDTRDLPGLKKQRGVPMKSDDATPGYILFTPAGHSDHYLMNLDGEIVHKWDVDLASAIGYMDERGHLFKDGVDPDFPTFAGGGMAGRIQEYDWEGNLVWDFEYANEEHHFHHDFAMMPNGNILFIAWEVKSPEEAIQAGRKPEYVPKAGMWVDHVVEVEPIRPTGGKIVWEWHLWDHLVQDYDESKDNYGVVGEHPRKWNINLHEERPSLPPEQIDGMKQAGVMPRNLTSDNWLSEWGHFNGIDYNAELDQIALSSMEFSEVYIIDHSTTTEEAKGSTGGRSGHGGDLLFRWGHPANYGKGDVSPRRSYDQHDIKWIPHGYPGEGHLTFYNNSVPGREMKYDNFFQVFFAMMQMDPTAIPLSEWPRYSAVYELDPAIDEDGNYEILSDGTFGPKEPTWIYTAADTFSFHSPFISGAHRMSNGNTFITEGGPGRFMEVNASGETVWEYWNPYADPIIYEDGTPAQMSPGPFMYWQFRATHIPADHPALAGKELVPIDPQPKHFVPPPPPGPPGQEH